MAYYEKTLLSCYKSIDLIVNQIESLIRQKARSSFSNFSSVESQAEKLINLNEARLDLIDLKSFTEEALSKLSNEDNVLLRYKYFGEMPNIEIDLKSRNYYRKQQRAIKRFLQKLEKLGLNEEIFVNRYLKIAFINGAYQKAIKEEGKKHVIE